MMAIGFRLTSRFDVGLMEPNGKDKSSLFLCLAVWLYRKPVIDSVAVARKEDAERER